MNVLLEWLGNGGAPVSEEKSSGRGFTCLSCPHNVRGNWFGRLKWEAAKVIKRHLEFKSGLKLKSPHDDGLGFCELCGCVLSLKIWVPIDHVGNHTSVSELEKYPKWCWIKEELTK